MGRFQWRILGSQRRKLLKLRMLITAHTVYGVHRNWRVTHANISSNFCSNSFGRMSSPSWSHPCTVSLRHLEKLFHVLSATRCMLQNPTSYFISIPITWSLEKNVTVMFLFGRTASVDMYGWLKARKVKPKLYLTLWFGCLLHLELDISAHPTAALPSKTYC